MTDSTATRPLSRIAAQRARTAAYKAIFQTTPQTPERKAAVKAWQAAVRADRAANAQASA